MSSAAVRDGAIVNPFADDDEFLDLYEAHVSSHGRPGVMPADAS